MLVNLRAASVVLWPARAAFGLLCWLAGSVGHTMVVLATAFKACRRAGARYGPVMIPAQVLLLVLWLPTRILFLLLHRAAVGSFHINAQLRRRLQVTD